MMFYLFVLIITISSIWVLLSPWCSCAQNRFGQMLVPAIALLAGLVLALLFYFQLGAPNVPSQPIAQRLGELEQVKTENALIEKLEAVLKANPNDQKGWQIAARVYLEAGMYVKASAAFDQLMRLDPQNISYKLAKAESLILKDKRQVSKEAEGLLLSVLMKDPQNLKAQFYQGFVFEQNGDPLKALETWKALSEKAQDNPPFLKLLRLEMARILQVMEQVLQPQTEPKK